MYKMGVWLLFLISPTSGVHILKECYEYLAINVYKSPRDPWERELLYKWIMC